MIEMTLAEIADVVGGTAHGDAVVTGGAFLDTRTPEPGGLFIALAGDRVDEPHDDVRGGEPGDRLDDRRQAGAAQHEHTGRRREHRDPGTRRPQLGDARAHRAGQCPPRGRAEHLGQAPAVERVELRPAPESQAPKLTGRPLVNAYVALTKPRVVSLLLFTTITAAFAAAGGWPGFTTLLCLTLGGYMSAGAANAIVDAAAAPTIVILRSQVLIVLPPRGD